MFSPTGYNTTKYPFGMDAFSYNISSNATFIHGGQVLILTDAYVLLYLFGRRGICRDAAAVVF